MPEPTVLVISGSPRLLRQLSGWLTEHWHVRSTKSLETALQLVEQTQPDVLVLDVPSEREMIDVVMGQLGRLTHDCSTPVLLTVNGEREGLLAIAAALETYEVLSEPIDGSELVTRVRRLLGQGMTRERPAVENVIRSLAFVVEARDPYTRGHSLRLAGYATAFAIRLGLDAEDADCLRRGAFLHDIGKIGVPDAVLLKPDRLDADEYAVVKNHTIIGDRLCSKLEGIRGLRPIIRNHHERLDGTGYPDGLKHDAIPLLAQVTSIVDVYDALTTDRPYRRAWPIARAYEELVHEASLGWRRRDLVEEFVRLSSEGGLPGLATFAEIELHSDRRPDAPTRTARTDTAPPTAGAPAPSRRMPTPRASRAPSRRRDRRR